MSRPDSYLTSYLDTIEQDIEAAQKVVDSSRTIAPDDAAHQARLDAHEFRLALQRIAVQNLTEDHYATRYVPAA
jgi:hypothetical protein